MYIVNQPHFTNEKMWQASTRVTKEMNKKKFKGVQLSVWPILGFQVKLHQLKHILIMQGETINVPKNQDNIVQH